MSALTDEERKARRVESSKRYYEKNKEKVKASAKEWKKANPEKVKQGAKVYRDATKEEMKILQAAWIAKNPEKRRAISKRHYDKYSEEKRENSRNWYANNRDLAKRVRDRYRSKPGYRAIDLNNQSKRRIRTSDGGRLSKNIVESLLSSQRGKCACCGLPLGRDFHIDHIMPLALGGKNIDSNVQLLRSTCNLRKHAKHPVDYMQEMGKLC